MGSARFPIASSLFSLIVFLDDPRAQSVPPGSQEAADVERRLQALEAAVRASQSASGPVAPPASAGAPQLRLIDVAFNLLAAAGASTVTDDELPVIQPGGHDPNRRGFTLQNGELTLAGAVDPYFRMDTHVILQIDPEGETAIELEEAYLTTLSLPASLQFRAGHWFTEFGRHNPRHPHQWDFVDLPLVNARLFGGDGLRATGARVSWLAPTEFFLELNTGVQNARGETQVSFLSNDDVGVFGGDREPFGRTVHDLGDLLYTERASCSFDLGDEMTIAAGGSALFGPNDTGPDGDSQIYGVDLYWRWKPLANDQGFPFVAATVEHMWRTYEADANVDSQGNPTLAQTYHDNGLYAQVTWGFVRPWVAGMRWDYVNGDGAQAGDPGTDREWRLSPNLAWFPTEFSKIRLQVNFAKAQSIGDDLETSVWLQFEVNIGAHGAHKF